MTDRTVPEECPAVALAEDVRSGDRAALARAITLVESRLPEEAEAADRLLAELIPHAGGAHRIGITGVPGVGKSTLIDALGIDLLERGHSVAVLAVDPSSTVSGGSILGDKSRMPRLARDERAFIRPSPSALNVGGVGRRTRESMLLCEAAGFDVVLVETVGVGQSETLVDGMVDTFLVLMLPGGGDELQGIKKGILELADLIAVNKADGDTLDLATRARAEYSAALGYLRSSRGPWEPRVVTVSAATGHGLAELWAAVEEHRRVMEAGGELEAKRRRQRLEWMWSTIEDRLEGAFRSHPAVEARLREIESAVLEGHTSPGAAADKLLDLVPGLKK